MLFFPPNNKPRNSQKFKERIEAFVWCCPNGKIEIDKRWRYEESALIKCFYQTFSEYLTTGHGHMEIFILYMICHPIHFNRNNNNVFDIENEIIKVLFFLFCVRCPHQEGQKRNNSNWKCENVCDFFLSFLKYFRLHVHSTVHCSVWCFSFIRIQLIENKLLNQSSHRIVSIKCFILMFPFPFQWHTFFFFVLLPSLNKQRKLQFFSLLASLFAFRSRFRLSYFFLLLFRPFSIYFN